MKIEATLLKDLEDINEAYLEGINPKKQVIKDIIIDEFHFFAPDSYRRLEELVSKGYQIIIAGLNWDYFRDEPFEVMANAMTIAKNVLIYTADCEYRSKDYEKNPDVKECNNPATKSMWKLDKLPQEAEDYVGGKEKYMSVCLHHYKPIQNPYER